jgi:hypothetical protein
LGNLIQFEFIEAADRVKVSAVCYYDDALVIEYFNTLWKEFAEFFPAVQASIAKPEEPAGTVDPVIVARREKVKELSLKKKTIDAIAQEVGADRSTVIRDRNELGITKKRR